MMKLSFARFLGAFIVLILFSGLNTAHAQLAAGDILFTGFDAQPGITVTTTRYDRVSFVALKEIPVGTIIYFTDRGYKAGQWFPANASTEGTVKLVVNTKITPAQEVLLVLTPENTTTNTNYYSATVEGTSIGTLTQQTARLSLGNTGDQLFAFQSSNGEPNASGAVLLAGLHWNVSQTGTSGNYTVITNDAGWDNLTTGTNPALTTTNSDIPPGLVAGQSAFWLGSIVTNVTSGYNGNVEAGAFNGAGKPYGNVAQIRSAVMNRSNWTRAESGPNSANITVPTFHFNGVLPVVLTKFGADLDRLGKLKVYWETSSEKNNSHFIVQISNDGKQWKELARKNAIVSGQTGGSYEVETSIATISLAGFGLLGLLLLPVSNRRLRMVCVLAVLCMFAFGCAKKDQLADTELEKANTRSGQTYFLRLVQVDLDGKYTYSEAIPVKAK